MASASTAAGGGAFGMSAGGSGSSDGTAASESKTKGGPGVGTSEMDVRLPAEYSEKIVRFHHLHLSSQKLKSRIAQLEEESRKLKDGAEEMALRLDLEGLKTSVGDAFVALPPEEVEERIEEATAEISKELEEKVAEKDAVDDELSTIKAELYAKFGSSINLD